MSAESLGVLRELLFGSDRGEDATISGTEPWLNDLRERSFPLFLPRRLENGATVWYGVARDARQFRTLQTHLLSFLGPSFSDFVGQPTQLNLADPVERAICDCFDYVARLEVPGDVPGIAEMAEERVRLLRTLLESRPPRAVNEIRPPANILRDLEEAIRQNNRTLADSLLDEARTSGEFSERNLTFLQFLTFQVSSAWEELLHHPRIESVLSQPRPTRVTLALIRAVYHKELAGFEATNDPRGAVEHFREKVWWPYRSLFGTRTGLNGKEVDVCFLLRAVAQEGNKPELLEQILATVPEGAEYHPWLRSLANTPVPTVTDRREQVLDPVDQGWAAFKEGDYDRAWKLARLGQGGFGRFNLLVQCALFSNSIEHAQFILEEREAIDSVTARTVLENERLSDLLERFSDRVQTKAEGGTDARPIDGWKKWAEELGGDRVWGEAANLAEDGASQWDLETVARDPEEAEEFSTLLEATSERNLGVLRAGVPHLLRALEAVHPEAIGLPRIYEALSLIVLADDAPGYTYFLTLSDLMEKTVELGVTPEKYGVLLSDIAQNVSQDGSPSRIDDLMELLDVLVRVRCPNHEARAGVAASVLAKARGLTPLQSTLLEVLVEECEVEFPPELRGGVQKMAEGEAPAAVSPLSYLSGCTVALYSLDSGVLRRVKEVLERTVDKIKVRIFDEHTGTPAMKDAARNAEYFVIATRSATHSATEFIGQNRSKRPTLFPAGKGSASMLAALFQ